MPKLLIVCGYVFQIYLIRTFTQRTELLASFFGNAIIFTFNIFLWNSLYRGIMQIDGVDRNHMLQYASLSFLLGLIFRPNVDQAIADRVHDGQIAIDYLRPINHEIMWIVEDIAALIGNIVVYAMPSAIIILAVFHYSFHEAIQLNWLFILSASLAYVILWELSGLIGLCAFWIVDISPIQYMNTGLVRILSGSFIPIWFFPSFLQTKLDYFPFKYIYQVPISIGTRIICDKEVLESIGLQLTWIILLLIALWILSRMAHKRVTSVGG